MNNEILNNAEEKMLKTLDSLDGRFNTVRTGRANPSSTNWKAGQTNGLENCNFVNRLWKIGTDAAGDYSYTFPKTF